MYVFLGTWRTSRGGLGASIRVCDRDELIKIIKGDKNRNWFYTIRFAKVNGESSSLLNQMTLEQFEEIFPIDLFTPKEITRFFSKTISEKYGEHAIRNAKPRISKKDLEIGRVYIDSNGRKVVYFGRIKGTFFTPEQKAWYYVPAKTEEFEGYYYKNYYNGNTLPDIMRLDKPIVTKSPRKFIDTTDTKIFVPTTYDLEHNNCKLHIEFLDVKGVM